MFGFLKKIFKFQFLFVLLAIFVGVYYEQLVQILKHSVLDSDGANEKVDIHFESVTVKEKLLSKEELAKYDGENGMSLYLAILGLVYNVTKGAKHYGNGCAYNFFIGRDASVAFITGEFNNFDEDTADDVVTLKPNDLLSLANWQSFYHKDYTYVGKLVGRFYDENGEPTTYHHKFLALLELARDQKAKAEQSRTIYPDCNIEWSERKGTRVWCTTTSGGKQRQWEGHPRKLFEVGSDNYRCACIRTEDLETAPVMIKQYDNCTTLSPECYYTVP